MKFLIALLSAAILICQIFSVYGGDLPPEIQKCKSYDNEECIAQAVETLFKLYPNGYPEINLPSPKALNITNFFLALENPNSPIQVTFRFVKCTLFGLENIKVLRASGFDKHFNQTEFILKFPKIRIIGDYESKGKVLLLPINGHGKASIQHVNSTLKVNAKFNLKKRNDKNYVQVEITKCDLKSKLVQMNFENIFYGNPELSDSINKVINENWKEVWAEIKDVTDHAISGIVNNLTNNVFNELPVENFFID